MHFVAALDDVPEMRAVLGLFEGVVTGAADGYGRMARRPAATLLHLGPGLGNGIANLHNARRARTPLVNVVGDHATTHLALRPAAHLRHREPGPSGVALVPVARPPPRRWPGDAVDAVQAPSDPPAVWPRWWCPADVSWQEAGEPASSGDPGPVAAGVGADAVAGAAKALRSGEPAVLLVGGSAVRAARAAGRQPGGAGLGGQAPVRDLPGPDRAGGGAPGRRAAGLPGRVHHRPAPRGQAPGPGRRRCAPVSFFAYPGMPGYLVPDGCEVHVLASRDRGRGRGARGPRRRAGGARRTVPSSRRRRAPTGPPARSTPRAVAAAIGALLPEGAIVSDEGNTSGLFVPGATAGAPRHDWLLPHRGGHRPGPARGHRGGGGLPRPPGAVPRGRRQRHVHPPVAVDPGPRGPRRDHRDLQQRLLRHPRARAQPGGGGRSRAAGPGHARHRPTRTSTSPPWPRGWGSPASRATTAEEFTDQLERAFATPGPALVEAVLR